MSMKLKSEDVEYIVIHCAATPSSMDVGVEEIDRWHRERGFWKVGYHYVIRRDGSLESGRDITEMGAHVKGFNSRSIGVCLIGGVDKDGLPEDNFTDDQFGSLRALMLYLVGHFPDAEIVGHRDLPGVRKDCPSFEVKQWLKKEDI